MSGSAPSVAEFLWSVYMVRSTKGWLYTGIAKDVARRVRKHNKGRGAKALRGQLPVVLVWQSKPTTHSAALQLEYRIKQLTHREKEQWLCENANA